MNVTQRPRLSRVQKSRFLPFFKEIQQRIWQKEQRWQTVAEHQLPVGIVPAMSLVLPLKFFNVIFCGLILHRGSVGAPASSSV